MTPAEFDRLAVVEAKMDEQRELIERVSAVLERMLRVVAEGVPAKPSPHAPRRGLRVVRDE